MWVTSHPSKLTRKQKIDCRRYFSYTVLQMPKFETCGQFEQLVLTAIAALGDNAYGITIHGKVQELSQPKPVTLGAVYVTLDRMEDKGFVSSKLSDPTPERGGRAKRFYHLEKVGVRVLQESAVVARRMGDLLDQVMGKDRKWRNA
jgi:PadR family transcriptional regulator, regulatory protein PadR